MPNCFLAPIANNSQVNANGSPLTGGTITTYQAGTSTPAATYADNAGVTPQAASIVLNTQGLPASPVWLLSGQGYKFVIKDALGNVIRTVDNIYGIDDAAAVTFYQKGSIPAVSAYLSAGQSVSSAVLTKVNFDTKDFDTASAFSAGRWTPGVPGEYDLQATVSLQVTSGSIAAAYVEFWKNGASFIRGFQANGSAVTILAAPVSAKVLLNATDYIEVYASITGTGTSFGGPVSGTRLTHFSGCLVRAA